MEDEKIKQVLMDRLKREIEIKQSQMDMFDGRSSEILFDLQSQLQGYNEAICNVMWDLFKEVPDQEEFLSPFKNNKKFRW